MNGPQATIDADAFHTLVLLRFGGMKLSFDPLLLSHDYALRNSELR